MIGKTILHYYRITEKLGEGEMGVVYKAEDTKLERTIALKFLSQSLIGGKEENERFKRKAKAAAAPNYPSIATSHAIEDVTNGRKSKFLKWAKLECESDCLRRQGHTQITNPSSGLEVG